MKTKFLWIEDNARTDLKHLLAPIFMSGKYNPVVAPTVAEGVYQMMTTKFEAIIVDIRLLPGNDKDWDALYTKLGRDKGAARLGLYLLYSLFDQRIDDVEIRKPDWIDPNLFGVLTVESYEGDVGEALESFGINVYERKTAITPHTTLLKMVERITGNAK
ncbi:MAG TPA: hypothetical protein VGC89_00460 [Pyrinomonadaceae bacterium]|jgi:hypothetical protein